MISRFFLDRRINKDPQLDDDETGEGEKCVEGTGHARNGSHAGTRHGRDTDATCNIFVMFNGFVMKRLTRLDWTLTRENRSEAANPSAD